MFLRTLSSGHLLFSWLSLLLLWYCHGITKLIGRMSFELIYTILVGIFIVGYYLEAEHDNILKELTKMGLKGKGPGVKEVMLDLHQEWHVWDFAKQVLLAIAISLALFFESDADTRWLFLPLSLGIGRFLFFNTFLNLIADPPVKINHLGGGAIDRFVGRVFGSYWQLFTLILFAISIIIPLWII